MAARTAFFKRCQKAEIRSQMSVDATFELFLGDSMRINSAKELTVYKKSYELAMEIFEVSKGFPPEERFALTSQIRRSSRSVAMNLREAWAKRRYEAHFVSKLSDCDGENSETDTSLDFGKDCGYISADKHSELTAISNEIGKMLGSMIRTPGKFTLKPKI